jgi:hypothetical protein
MGGTDLNNMDQFKVICRLLQLLLLSGVTLPIARAQKLGDLAVQSKHQLEFKDTVAMPEELKCLGFIHETLYPLDILVSGTEQEGLATFLMEGSIVHLNGPGLKSSKAGDSFRVVRTEAKIRDRLTQKFTGYYYKELGTIKIDSLRGEAATGTVVTNCDTIFKGDFLLPLAEKATVKFTGEQANRQTAYPQEGLASSIVLGRNDLRELAAGHFCFIGIGTRDGVKIGDRFTIYRVQPPFDPKDLIVNSSYVRSGVEDIQAAGNKVGGVQTPTQYDGMQSGRYRGEIIQKLKDRSIAHRVMGDLIVVEAGETTSATKIINSRFEIHLGDVVVRR